MAPRGISDPRNWWNERDSNPHLPLARRGLSQLSYHPIVVPGVGFEPTSPRFRRGAFTRLASQACLARTRRIELLSPEWRSSIEPINYIRLNGGKWTESNLLPGGTAFTARRRHQPVLIGTSQNGSGPTIRTWPTRLMRPRGPQDCPHNDCRHQDCRHRMAARRRVDRHARRHSSASNGDWRPLQLTRRRWRKAAVSIRSDRATQPLSKRCRPPDRLTFPKLADGGRSRSPSLAGPSVFKSAPATPPVHHPYWLSRRDSNARPPPSEGGALFH
jgi:hypothetical protein